MADKKNLKAKIWVYAVVLFTSAFIVLLITAYSQIKQQKSIDDYKIQISNQQNENKKYQLSYSNSQEMIEKLTGENEKLTVDNKNFSDTIDKLSREINLIEKEKQVKLKEYENLSEAQLEYLKGNIVASAQILKKTDPKDFSDKTLEVYNLLSAKVYSEAGKLLFDEGYNLYQKSDYSEAIGKFLLSRDISKNDSFSDNCLYYLAHAYHKTGDTQAALELMKNLIQEYPTSSFIRYARSFIQKFE